MSLGHVDTEFQNEKRGVVGPVERRPEQRFAADLRNAAAADFPRPAAMPRRRTSLFRQAAPRFRAQEHVEMAVTPTAQESGDFLA